MAYTFDENNKNLDINTPIIADSELLAICKEIDEDTPAEEITLFIQSAHIIVCEHLDGYSISTLRLALVERYLAAHFAAITYPQAVFESVGKVQASYSMKVALRLEQTRYGQQALFFDPTKNLKKLDEPSKTFGITWLGMTDQEWEARNATA